VIAGIIKPPNAHYFIPSASPARFANFNSKSSSGLVSYMRSIKLKKERSSLRAPESLSKN